jgi:hypothetical protein
MIFNFVNMRRKIPTSTYVQNIIFETFSGPEAQCGWPTMLMTLLSGDRTKNRRRPLTRSTTRRRRDEFLDAVPLVGDHEFHARGPGLVGRRLI